MTDNFDEFEGEEQTLDPAQKPPSVAANLAHAWRARPLFKLLVLMTAVGAIVAASMSLFSGHESVENSRLVNPPDLKVAPGGPVSPYMKQQTDLANDQRARTALDQGGSALPTPVGQSTDVSDLTENKNKTDALAELRAEVEILQKQQVQQQEQVQQKLQQVQQAAPPPPQPRPPEPFDDTLSQSMQRQMAQLMETWSPRGVKAVTVTKTDENGGTKGVGAPAGTGVPSTSTNPAVATTPQQAAPKILVPAGTVSYAQLLIEANSDVPGSILASIVSGPLAGARAVGQFQIANGYNDYLVLQFNLADRKGTEYQINAVALDPSTTLGGLATEVDQRYFSRVVLPAAAGFLQGLGSALGQNNSSTTTSGSFAVVQQSKAGAQQGVFQGLAQGAQTAAQFFQNQANLTKPLVRVAAGTPMGIFFVAPVYDPSTIPVNPQTGLPGYAGYPGAGAAGGAAGYGQSPYGQSPYGQSPYGQSPYGLVQGASPYGTAGAASGYNVPYPNYATPNSVGNGSSVSYAGAGLNNGYPH